ncbi:hypothetical protein GCM10007304_40640 [Rhodococcoides trifolii]|uniref:Uncharacterized protein n=1 Tax=Rhodococcoides trifolii TaxID=908250 RepID=A0A917LH35_9NOCA|nr:hypothetical protein GCM10007304_40640 [Rhodococcus trifolii]
METFLLITIATILLTRAYLEITDYPQVGGGSLHIAHALYGGGSMVAALIVGWMFVGFGVRVWTVVLGGVGFGLFLDEVGKFVTTANDYFYGPAAEIMYIVVVAVLVIGRLVRDRRPPNAQECLANAATIVAEGIAHGLPDSRRQWAGELLVRARELGADEDAVHGCAAVLLRCPRDRGRLRGAQLALSARVPRLFRSPHWVSVVGWLLVLVSGAGAVLGTVALVLGGIDLNRRDLTLQLDDMNLADGILFVSALLTFVLAAPAMIARRRTDSVWPLRWLRAAALIFTMLNALVDFAQEGFAALGSVVVGLFCLAVISHRITVVTRGATATKRSGDVRL